MLRYQYRSFGERHAEERNLRHHESQHESMSQKHESMLTAQNAGSGASHRYAGADRRAYLADGHDVDHEAPPSKLHLGLCAVYRAPAVNRATARVRTAVRRSCRWLGHCPAADPRPSRRACHAQAVGSPTYVMFEQRKGSWSRMR
jgi:hypothetical protein